MSDFLNIVYVVAAGMYQCVISERINTDYNIKELITISGIPLRFNKTLQN